MKNSREIKNYVAYLEIDKGLVPATSIHYATEVTKYIQWRRKTKRNGVVKYVDIIDYLEYLRTKNYQYSTLVEKLRPIKHYYNFKKVKINPVEHIKLMGREKPVLKDILSEHQILDIYTTYKSIKHTDKHKHQRNVVMLGLMCFQGVKTIEISKIRLNEVVLERLSIKVPKSSRINSRTMQIRSEQLIDLHIYITDSREELLHGINQTESDFLIIGNVKEDSLKNTFAKIVKEISQEVTYFKSMQQIRSSLIVNWLKSTNLRKVQYYAGHKYISSTEHYKIGDLSLLTESVIMSHPMG